MSEPHTRLERDTAALPLTVGLLFFAPIVLLGSEVGAVLRFRELGSAVLFPPYALLTAALVASPRRQWVWYILIAVAAHMTASLPLFGLQWVLFSDVANITRALVAAVLLRRLFVGHPRLDSVPALFRFFASAVVVAPAVGATIGAANTVLRGTSSTYGRPWVLWFLSSALTALIMLPGLLIATQHRAAWRFARIDRRRFGEALLLAGALAISCVVAFFLQLAGRANLTLLFYAPLPFLIWAALRFGPGGASLGLTAVAIAAVAGADRGTGPFVSMSRDENVFTLQLFMLLTALPVLCIAVVGSARQGAVQLYRALLGSLQDHVAILDARGIVLEVNQSWQQFADAGHDCPFDRVRAGDNYLAACREAIDLLRRAGTATEDITAARALDGVESVLHGKRRRFEMEYEQDFGVTREWYTMRAETLERPAGGVVVTRANVSVSRRAQLEIEEQRRELSHLARVSVLGQLSGALAHELRQPLSSILSNAEAARHLLRRQPPDLEELSAILLDIANEDRRAAQVIDGLRAMLKRGETHVQPLDTAALVREVLALARAELITRRVTATAVVDAHMPLVLADRVQVQQVLLNLILNACEAMSSTTAADRTLLLTATASAGDVRFSVCDCGPGIPPALIKHLFEPFVTTKPDGLGLGLSIARSIVAAHGGRIWAENNADRGATVHCVFASAAADDVRPIAPTLVAASSA